MALHKTKAALPVLGVLGALALTACDNSPPPPMSDTTTATTTQPDNTNKPKLGLMTSLPIYWPLDAEFGDIASGEAEVPWQREVLERGHELVLLDTLTPIPGLTPDAPETDPLAGLKRLAVIQPRGLSPADNVALDEWVRAGGHLLLVLDPMLTGHYDLALGDPRRPTDAALIPPVIARWGLEITFDEAQSIEPRSVNLRDFEMPVEIAGEIFANGRYCPVDISYAIISCSLGEGSVFIIADAAIFEHRELAGENGEAVSALLQKAFR